MTNHDPINLLDTVRRVHFVGIGGSGMTPIAEILHEWGYIITGSDVLESDNLEHIRAFNIPVFMGHKAENIGDAEMLVYTAAVKKDNPELVAAREKGIHVIERSVAMGLVSKKHSDVIAISGTHGKTTTTGMIAQILMTAKRDPSAIIGGRLPFIGENGHVGKDDAIVLEACEFVDTFLQIYPTTAVITNIDADHLEYFGTLENIIRSFHQFATQTSRRIVVNGDDANSMKALENITNAEIITFGLSDTCDYYAAELNKEDAVYENFTLCHHGEPLCRIELHVPGKHNLMNALAAAAAAHVEGVEPEYIKEALEAFGGVHRRFEILGQFEGITFADDFAHHPTELEAVLSSAMRMGYREVLVVFQPYTFSRTKILLDDFARVLSIPDRCVMTEICAAREENTYNIYTSDLAAKVPGSVWFQNYDQITDYILDTAKPGDLVLSVGCGDVYKCANLAVRKYKTRLGLV